MMRWRLDSFGVAISRVLSVDPGHGVVFYALPTRLADMPRLTRVTSCLPCHYGPATQGVPGLLVGSISTDSAGHPTRGADIRTDRPPHAVAGPLGGLVCPTRCSTRRLMRRPSSDRVALMTLEHQTQMINLLTRLEWETRMAKHEGLLGYGLAEHMQGRVDDVLRYMLFVNEAVLPEPMRGCVHVQRDFSSERTTRPGWSLAPGFRSRDQTVPVSAQLHGLQPGL